MFTTAKDIKPNIDKDGIEDDRVIGDIKDSARRLHGDAKDSASAIKEDLEGVARRTGQHVRELADSAGHSLADAGEGLVSKIRDNPVQSTLIALGVGLIAGILYRR